MENSALNFDPLFAEFITASMAITFDKAHEGIWKIRYVNKRGDGWGATDPKNTGGWGVGDPRNTGGWGVGVGALYLSFFGKLFEPGGDYSSNIPGGMLTLLIGLAFVTAIAGFIASLTIPFESTK